MNLTLQLGRDDTFSLTAKVGGVALDLRTCKVYVACKLVRSIDAAPLISKSSDAGSVTKPNDTTGNFSFVITAADRAGLSDLVTYFWEVLVVKADGTSVTPDDYSGLVMVLPALLLRKIPPLVPA